MHIKRYYQNSLFASVHFVTTNFVVALLTCVLIGSGCSSDPKLPTDTGTPDDTTGQGGSGNNGGLGQYGTLYFQSNAGTSWLTEPSTSVLNGVLLAENESSDTLLRSIIYDGRITFGVYNNLYFLWRGGVSGNAVISFYVSSDGLHWQSTSYFPDGDWQVASHVLFTAGTPLTFRFEFKLPPGGRVRITDVRAYGK